MYCTRCGGKLEANFKCCPYCEKKCESINTNISTVAYLKESLQRPDKNISKSHISRVDALIGNTEKMLYDYKEKRQFITRIYKSLLEEIVQKKLKNLSIEHLNEVDKGLRLIYIRNIGIENVAQILRLSKQQFVAIPGVGEQTIRQVMAAATKIENYIRKNAEIKIDPDERTSLSTQMVSALFTIRRFKKDVEIVSNIFNSHLSHLLPAIKSARKIYSFRWFLSFKKSKTDAINSLDNLLEFSKSITANTLSNILLSYNTFDANNESTWEDFSNHSADYYSLLESILKINIDLNKVKGDLPQELVNRIESQRLNSLLLKSSLRNYQEFGAKFALAQSHVLIGDEMGLGKTIEAIAVLAHLQVEGAKYFLVICPASVLINWCREIRRHSQLVSYKVHGSDCNNALASWVHKGGVAVSTYETIKTIELKMSLEMDMLVIDEAHYVKNPSTQRTQAIHKLIKISNRVLFMTGTPLENRIEEMKSLINLLQPKVAAELDTVGALVDAPKFRQQIAPVYLRRNRDDVLKELPELVQVEDWVYFGTKEEIRYREAVQEGKFMTMRRVAWTGGSREDSPKLKRLFEICEDAKENKHKTIIFSFFRDVISMVYQALGEECMEPITGDVSPDRRQQIIDEFTKSSSNTALICQIQAGGYGLNIQAARVVVFCEPQIKPSLETQAISRAYRMGQVHRVVVHRLLTEDSVDERMMEILNNKQLYFDSYARDSVIADSSLQAKSIEIVTQEQKRLGLPIKSTVTINETI